MRDVVSIAQPAPTAWLIAEKRYRDIRGDQKMIQNTEQKERTEDMTRGEAAERDLQ